MSSKKRPHKSSSSSCKKQRAGADEEARLVDALSEKKPTRKEIESTEPGGAPNPSLGADGRAPKKLHLNTNILEKVIE